MSRSMEYYSGELLVPNDSLYPLLSVLKSNILHQLQYHACDPVWYWGILISRKQQSRYSILKGKLCHASKNKLPEKVFIQLIMDFD